MWPLFVNLWWLWFVTHSLTGDVNSKFLFGGTYRDSHYYLVTKGGRTVTLHAELYLAFSLVKQVRAWTPSDHWVQLCAWEYGRTTGYEQRAFCLSCLLLLTIIRLNECTSMHEVLLRTGITSYLSTNCIGRTIPCPLDLLGGSAAGWCSGSGVLHLLSRQTRSDAVQINHTSGTFRAWRHAKTG